MKTEKQLQIEDVLGDILRPFDREERKRVLDAALAKVSQRWGLDRDLAHEAAIKNAADELADRLVKLAPNDVATLVGTSRQPLPESQMDAVLTKLKTEAKAYFALVQSAWSWIGRSRG